jgi:hypothetical protein
MKWAIRHESDHCVKIVEDDTVSGAMIELEFEKKKHGLELMPGKYEILMVDEFPPNSQEVKKQ